MAKSPFPGMDPYLETYWGDVHVDLMQGIKQAVQEKLPPSLRARNEQEIYIEEEDDDGEVRRRISEPDVFVVERRPGSAEASGGAAVAELPDRRVKPVSLTLRFEPVRHRWIQIIDIRDSNRVVTVIEVLNPSNKRAGKLNRLYRRKLQDFARGGVSVVEIDLLRSSRRHLPAREEDVPERRRTPYYVGVRRTWSPRTWQMHPIPLRDPLPSVPIPLRREDAEVWLDLQPLIDRAYVAGGYDDTDYAKPARPPLKGDDAAWADELLKTAGRR